jgi:hypothetical protein
MDARIPARRHIALVIKQRIQHMQRLTRRGGDQCESAPKWDPSADWAQCTDIAERIL